MARQGISYEQIAKTADELVNDGQQPTIRLIRDRIGTGSPNTIHKHLSAWREAKPQTTTTPQELPANLSAQIATELGKAASNARAEIESRLIQSQSEAAELAATGESLEIEIDSLLEQITQLTRERDTLNGKANQQAADLAETAQRIEREQQAAETARIELATARLKIEAHSEKQQALSQDNERLRTALDTSQQARHHAEQQAAVLTAKLEAMTDRATKAEERAEKAEQNALQFSQEAAELRGRLNPTKTDRENS